jgi:signal peptidase II
MKCWRIKGIVIAFLVILADQFTKWGVVTYTLAAQPHSGFLQWLIHKNDQANFVMRRFNEFLNVVLVWNPGISFGMLQTNKMAATYALTIMAVIVSGAFLAWLWREPKAIRGVTVGLIVGGALGNIWDRLRFGAVIDFIDLHMNGHHWPAFNIADSAICIAVTILLIETLFFSSKNTAKRSL